MLGAQERMLGWHYKDLVSFKYTFEMHLQLEILSLLLLYHLSQSTAISYFDYYKNFWGVSASTLNRPIF